MLITFKSQASGDVIMFGDVAKKLLAIIGKDPGETRGIVTVEQLPGAIQRLQAAIETDKAAQKTNVPGNDEEDEQSEQTGMNAPVDLAQRAWPLLDALEYAARDGVPVIWESN